MYKSDFFPFENSTFCFDCEYKSMSVPNNLEKPKRKTVLVTVDAFSRNRKNFFLITVLLQFFFFYLSGNMKQFLQVSYSILIQSQIPRLYQFGTDFTYLSPTLYSMQNFLTASLPQQRPLAFDCRL